MSDTQSASCASTFVTTMPDRYGNWKTVYNRFANWAKAGHWERIFKALQISVGSGEGVCGARDANWPGLSG